MTVAMTFADASKLKKEIDERFSVHLHFHDRCGGQFFSIEERNDEIKKYVEAYFEEMNLKAVFSDDGLEFTVEE